MDDERFNSADSTPSAGNFLGTATDNRISIVDPDRWEGLDSGDEDKVNEPRKTKLKQQQQQQQQQPEQRLSTYRDSGEYENEGYRMFMTHRQLSDQTLPSHPQPPPGPADATAALQLAKEADEETDEDQEERFMENLGSRLVRHDVRKSDRPADDDVDEDITPRASAKQEPSMAQMPPPQQAPVQQPQQQLQPQQHFSVRRGANQLSDLLPEEQRDRPKPQPPAPIPSQAPQPQPQARQRQHPLGSSIVASGLAAGAEALPMVPKEVYAGYLRLDSGHVLGPFRWTVESVETPATVDEGLDTAVQKRPGDLYSILIDGQQTARGNGAATESSSNRSSRHRVLTRTGRLEFFDQAGNANSLEQQPQQRSVNESAAVGRSLESLAGAVASMADGGSRVRIPEADGRLTKLMADALIGNGASLVLACTSTPHQPSGGAGKQQRKATLVDASVVASNLQPDSGVDAALLEQKQELDQLHQLLGSMRKELDILKTENGSLKGRLKEAEAAVVAASAAGGSASADPLLRPVSKSSYQSLYEMLQEYMQENEHLRNENLDLVKYQGEYRREQDQLAKENRKLASKLDRLQRQQQQPSAQAPLKPVYVISNPQSRASPSNLKQQPQPQPPPPQPLQQQLENPATEMPLNLPPIQQAFQTPNASSPSQGSSLRSQQLLLQHQQMRLRQQQLQQQLELQNAYYQSHMPVGPVYQQQPQQQPQQQQQFPPMQPPPGFQAPQQHQQTRPQPQPQQPPAHHQYPVDSPLYVPKPGEKTYRGRYQQQAAAAVVRDPAQHSRQPETKNHAAQDVGKLNESLKNELRQLDGAIQQHQRVNALQSDIRRNEGRKVLKTF